jgi:phosphate/sulfate permease
MPLFMRDVKSRNYFEQMKGRRPRLSSRRRWGRFQRHTLLVKAVRWGAATNILWAWVLTIPAAVMAGIVFALIRLVNPHA